MKDKEEKAHIWNKGMKWNTRKWNKKGREDRHWRGVSAQVLRHRYVNAASFLCLSYTGSC